MSEWILHVKQYAKTHNVSYGDAMKLAKPSYKQHGGNLKSMVRKAKNTVNKAEKVAARVNKRADVIGRKAKNTVETVGRKAKNTAVKVSEYADEALPAVTAFNPELGATLYAANAGLKEVTGSGAGRGRKLGSKNKQGGSFKTAGAGVGSCHACGGAVGRSRSSKTNMVVPPKSLADRLKNN